jgi:xanthine dehydrogenase small subunit
MHAMGPSPHWPRERIRDTSRLATLGSDLPVRMSGFFAPRTLEDLADAYAAAPDSLLLAGATDVGLWVTKQLRELAPTIYIGDVAGLQAIEERDRALEIGAAASLSDAFSALVKAYPALAEIANRFGSPPVRNAGTLCGNIANGSPIGDSMPALIAIGAEVVLRHGAKERALPLEALYSGYRQKTLARGEFVRAVRVPLPRKDLVVASYKVSKRFDQDISAVCGAFALTLRGDTVTGARIAYGGMAATPKRATGAENALEGRRLDAATVRAAVEALRHDFAPIDDMRASAAYRLRVAGALLERFADDHGPAAARGATRVRDFSFGATT